VTATRKLGEQKRFAAGEAEDADAEAIRVFKETDSDGDVEPLGPFDRHAAMRAGEVALVRAGEGQVGSGETCACGV